MPRKAISPNCSSLPDFMRGRPKTAANVSISGCGDRKKVNSELQFVFALLRSTVRSSCTRQVEPLLCRYVYRDCSDSDELVTRRLCLEVNTSKCESLKRTWMKLDKLPKKNSGLCVRPPDCAEYFTWDNSSNSTGQCPYPLTKTTNVKYSADYPCSPPCKESEWKTPVLSNGCYGALLLTVVFGWCVLFVIFFTWLNTLQL